MPAKLEAKLKAEARKKGFKGRRAARYVYGALNNKGYMHGNKETAAGRAVEKKMAKKHRPVYSAMSVKD